MSKSDASGARQQAEEFQKVYKTLTDEMSKVIVGQEAVVEGVLDAFFCDGHALLEGVPGLAKTLLVKTLADCLDLQFSRIQFTPDLMPADVTGTMVITDVSGGGRELRFDPGPILSNVVLADEINRATPKTQSALLEAMQERTVSVARESHPVPTPFVVLATQNPVEQEGTYPLPEAQLDRFLAKLIVDYPAEADLLTILDRTTGAETPTPQRVTDGDTVKRLRKIVREVPVPQEVKEFIARVITFTQGKAGGMPEEMVPQVALGSSPRGAQALVLLAKVRALREGRFAAGIDDVKAVAPNALRHRVMISYEGRMAGLTPDDVIAKALASGREAVTA